MKTKSNMHRNLWLAVPVALTVLLSVSAPAVFGQDIYQKPPQAIQDVLDALPTPQLSINPTGDTMLFGQPPGYPSIEDFSQPMLRIAGLRIDPLTNGPSRPRYSIGYTLKGIPDGNEIAVDLPADAKLGSARWSPDGKHFAFTNTRSDGIDLWISNLAGEARRIAGVVLNAAYGTAIQWMPDSRTLLIQRIPAGRGTPPEEPLVPTGPNIQETSGRSGAIRTYQDLLETRHDVALFDYHGTAQLAFVDTTNGRVTNLGTPGLFQTLSISPDGTHFLVVRLQKPYSYLFTHRSFPRMVEIWDRSATVEHTVARISLQENVPIGGVATDPRSYSWIPTESATMLWAEALDGGDPKSEVTHRDSLKTLAAPFSGSPTELFKTENRYRGIQWLQDGRAMVTEYHRINRWNRTFLIGTGSEPKLIWDMSAQDRYNDPGRPVSTTLSNGRRAVMQNGDSIFLAGNGSSPDGDHPFLDRLNLNTLETERLFQSAAGSYEAIETPLGDSGTRWITRRESKTEPPNYRIRDLSDNGAITVLTNFEDPTPQLRNITKRLVKYKREDGVDLSFTLYLPPDYEEGTRLPTVVWAYPREYNDAATAGQVSGSTDRFTTIRGASQLFFVLNGYALLDGATMPVIGDPITMNETMIDQIIMSGKAAIEKAAEIGVSDPNRVGVGGHSYGAFMTANLLAHSDLFRAGIARSGAYNRSLTPFGFQSEQRTFWEAPELYFKVSPFMHADKVNEPILLTHGEADNNSGTFPIQSDRMFHALTGHGATARLVTLPNESHGYAAKESVEHTLYEMMSWFERFVKDAQPIGRK